MLTIEQQIMEDYRRRIMSPTSSESSTVGAVAKKFGKSAKQVRAVISKLQPKRTKDGIWYEVVDSEYKDLMKVIVHIYGEQVIWHTTSTEAEVKKKVERLKHRRAMEM